MSEEKFTDIGHGVSYQFAVHREGKSFGIIFRHPCSPPNENGSWVPCRWRNEPDAPGKWVVESEEPLTLSPSLLCTTCGHHGFIRSGKWEPV